MSLWLYIHVVWVWMHAGWMLKFESLRLYEHVSSSVVKISSFPPSLFGGRRSPEFGTRMHKVLNVDMSIVQELILLKL